MRISDWSSDVCSSDLIAGNGERDVRFEQGDAHFAHRGAHVRLGQRATAAQPIENTAKPVAQAIEHTNSNPFRENTKAANAKHAGGRNLVGRRRPQRPGSFAPVWNVRPVRKEFGEGKEVSV